MILGVIISYYWIFELVQSCFLNSYYNYQFVFHEHALRVAMADGPLIATRTKLYIL